MKISIENNRIIAKGSNYTFEWNSIDDKFRILDSNSHVIVSGNHQPGITIAKNKSILSCTRSQQISYEAFENSIKITYEDEALKTFLMVCWTFEDDYIYLKPIEFESLEAYDLVDITYFAASSDDSAKASFKPSLYSRYTVVPGLCMSTNVSPVIDLHSKLSVLACLGSGAMRGPGMAQQWGLPSHYFCTFNTIDRWNSINAKNNISAAACFGLTELPQGDFRLDIRDIAASPVLNIRSDIWHHQSTPGKIITGLPFVITFGSNYYESIRNYYRVLLKTGVIKSKAEVNSQKKIETLLMPQYNTWGVEVSKAMNPEELTKDEVLSIYDKFKKSGMKAGIFVIDDKWEDTYGELRHDEARFPSFEKLLDKFRQDGYKIGLWAAFLRCQNPSALGLNESHLLQTPDGAPLWLSHQTAKYGIFDITQPEVIEVLKIRAKEFMRRYKPDLIKFDFGYELPAVDKAAPFDKTYSGERLIKKGLETIIGAMKEINPDLVVMYYGLSPLLLEYYDLHSPDDLVYCGGDYDLESNRRIFFSSLCGEIGMPTYSSSGYDWASAPDIWFDTAASGTPGSLHCFDGDENGALPDKKVIAKYNGIASIIRKTCSFSVYPTDTEFSFGMRAALSSSWERVEKDRSVLIALRKNRLDGKPGKCSLGAVIDTDASIVVSSISEQSIEESKKVGLVPFGDGTIVLKNKGTYANITEHYLEGKAYNYKAKILNNELKINFKEYNSKLGELEWIEINS